MDLKILLSDWLRAFWSISKEYDFSGTQQIIKIFIIEENLLTLMTIFFFNFKKT